MKQNRQSRQRRPILFSKDIAKKDFVNLNDVFADVVSLSGLLNFELDPGQLHTFEDRDVVERIAREPQKEQSVRRFKSFLHSVKRDCAKYIFHRERDGKDVLLLLGIENQTRPDRAISSRLQML